ncbi:MAG: hypothetical protein IPK48_07335 [Gammaproteobacteria bacterium]|nr:hypothetical protein [Gammaproteobacteria bacterium]
MAGEFGYAQGVVDAAFAAADQRQDMSPDAMGRALIQAVIDRYRRYRTSSDVGNELMYLAGSLDDDEPVITRGC